MHLTRRETAILARIALGWNDRAIAESMNVQLATARKHRENIAQKLGAHKAALLVWHYFRLNAHALKKTRGSPCRMHSRKGNWKCWNYWHAAIATSRSPKNWD